MNCTTPTVDPAAILQAWMPFKELVGVTLIKTEEDYARVADLVNVLLDEIRDDEAHPLSDVLHYLTVQMEAYEAEHVEIPEVEPKAVLRFLMEQHGLKQSDLSEIGSQGGVSVVLTGMRELNFRQVRALSERFGVSAATFV